MGEDQALALGLAALGHLVADEAALSRLMAETGIDPGDLKARAGEPALLGAVLDFIFADEGLLLDFCRAEGLSVNAVIKARAALPGGMSALEGWA
jgi:hypothetical protein